MEVDRAQEDVDMQDTTLQDVEGVVINKYDIDTVKDGPVETSEVTAQAAKDTALVSLLTTGASAGSEEDIPFLTGQILTYLRGLSAAVTWQNLVAAYLTFEKGGPAIGVSPSVKNIISPDLASRNFLPRLDPEKLDHGSNDISIKSMSQLWSMQLSTGHPS